MKIFKGRSDTTGMYLSDAMLTFNKKKTRNDFFYIYLNNFAKAMYNSE